MSRIYNKFFLSCLTATELIEKKIHFKLSFIEQIKLLLHKRICKACKIYEKNSHLIERGLKQSGSKTFSEKELQDFKILLKDKLRKINSDD